MLGNLARKRQVFQRLVSTAAAAATSVAKSASASSDYWKTYSQAHKHDTFHTSASRLSAYIPASNGIRARSMTTTSPKSHNADDHSENKSIFDGEDQNTTASQSKPLDPRLKLAKHVLTHFPSVEFAIAYGSLAVPQLSNPNMQPDKDQMLDFIFGVHDARAWHRRNLHMNPHHYSMLKHIGLDAICKVQEAGAGIYYNPGVVVTGPNDEPIKIKYGVIEVRTLCRDLIRWDSLYVSGRMHKPVLLIETNPQLRIASNCNLHQAVAMALLQLPATFTESQLYEKIAGLSYEGDSRMKLGAEPSNKVEHLVGGALPSYRELYEPVIRLYVNANENKEYLELCKLQAQHKLARRGTVGFPSNLDPAILKKLTSGTTQLKQPIDTVTRCRLLMQTPLALHIAMYRLSVEDARSMNSKPDVPPPPHPTLNEDEENANKPFWENFPFGFLAPEPAPSAVGPFPQRQGGGSDTPDDEGDKKDGPSDPPSRDPPPDEVPPPDSDDRRGRERGPREGLPPPGGEADRPDLGEGSYHFNDSSGYTFDLKAWSRLAEMSRQDRLTDLIKRGIASIVSESSSAQTVKGLATGGIVKAAKYAFAKLRRSLTKK